MMAGQQKKIDRLRTSLSTLDKENRELIQMRRRNLITDAEFTTDHDVISGEINRLRESLANLQTATRFWLSS